MADIRVSRIKAPRGVDRTKASYIRLKDSIEDCGIMRPISLSEVVDPVTKEETFVVLDGLSRFACAQDLGFETVPAQIKYGRYQRRSRHTRALKEPQEPQEPQEPRQTRFSRLCERVLLILRKYL